MLWFIKMLCLLASQSLCHKEKRYPYVARCQLSRGYAKDWRPHALYHTMDCLPTLVLTKLALLDYYPSSGLRIARKLLIEINEMGMPCAGEALDLITPQYMQELFVYTAIGARTTEVCVSPDFHYLIFQ